MREKRFQRFCVRSLLARRSRHWPPSERVQSPRFHVQCAGLCGIRSFGRFCLCHVAVGNGAEGRCPFVIIRGLDRRKRFAHIHRIESDQRIHSIFCALNRFSLDFFQRSVSLLLRRHACKRERKKNQEQQGTATVKPRSKNHSLCPFQLRQRSVVVRRVVVFFRHWWMPAPRPFH